MISIPPAAYAQSPFDEVKIGMHGELMRATFPASNYLLTVELCKYDIRSTAAC
jgi:hypothetical protein